MNELKWLFSVSIFMEEGKRQQMSKKKVTELKENSIKFTPIKWLMNVFYIFSHFHVSPWQQWIWLERVDDNKEWNKKSKHRCIIGHWPGERTGDSTNHERYLCWPDGTCAGSSKWQNTDGLREGHNKDWTWRFESITGWLDGRETEVSSLILYSLGQK